jgi:two-component system, chemotaxis family, CheB/CheR fusion protein
MNEELQSTNEELETTNTELRMRSDELNTANAFLASILTGLEVAVVVVDPKLQVLAWNHRAEDLWGLRANEVQGRHLMNLDIGLPVEQLRQPVHAVLAGETQRAEPTLQCRNRRGKDIRCPIRCTPLTGTTGEMLGAILLMEEIPMPSSYIRRVLHGDHVVTVGKRRGGPYHRGSPVWTSFPLRDVSFSTRSKA